jgi:hypothetical protein
VAKRDQLSGPIVRGAARLHPNPARRQRGEKRHHLRSGKAPAENDLPLAINRVHLAQVLGQIETNGGNLHGGRLLSVWRSATTTLWHIDAGEQGPSTPSV